MKTLFL